MKKIQEDHQCPICLTILYDPISLTKCKHIFCKLCIEDSIELAQSKKCPLCRVAFQENQMNKIPALEATLIKLYPQLMEEKRKLIPKKYKIKLIVGNTTRLLQTQQNNKYQWTLYLKQAEGEPSLSSLFQKIDINLHPTFVPKKLTYNPSKEIVELKRIGWGTFRIGIDLFWKKQYGGGSSSLFHDLQFVQKSEKIAVCHYRLLGK